MRDTRIAIVGSRRYAHPDVVERVVSSLAPNVVVISGGASGVDMTAQLRAIRRGMSCVVIRPGDPGRKSEYHVRNDVILLVADAVVAFWDGESPGTKSVIEKARAQGIPLDLYLPDGTLQMAEAESGGRRPSRDGGGA